MLNPQEPPILQQALTLHQQGQFAQAKALYEQIITAEPQNPDALHLLGVLAFQTGHLEKALVLINQAISIIPEQPCFYSNRGLVFQGLKQWDAAISSHTQAITLKPDYAEAYCNRGLALQGLNRLEEAITNYNQAINFNPQYVEAYTHRGLAFYNLNQMEAAVSSYNQAITLSQNPAKLLSIRGVALQALGQIEAAITDFNIAITLEPDFAEAYSNRGIALQELNQLNAALTSHNQAIALNPDSTKFYSNRGATFQALQQMDAAINDFNRAIDLDPNSAEAYSNRGTVFQALNQPDAAIASHNQAITIRPDYAEAYCNRGSAFHALNQLDAAIASYDQAIALAPNHAEAHANKSMALLLSGDFFHGWPLYEWRWKNKKNRLIERHFSQPLWLGEEPLNGKKILLYAEQGLGDTLQFCRYAKLVANLGAKVILEVHPSLFNLLEHLDGVSELVKLGDPLPHYDYHCPLLSLPLAFKTDIRSIPHATLQLQNKANKLAYWAEKLGSKTSARVGLVWSGSATHVNDHNRSIILSELVRHLPANLQYVSLQKEVREVDHDALKGSNILYFGDELHDFVDTAAICEQVDVVVSVDTSVAHLSASLGRPTWLLLPFSPDWRWLLNRDDSPWYPSMKLYRQESIGNWESVLAKLHRDLNQLSISNSA